MADKTYVTDPSDADMPKRILSSALHKALVEAGVVRWGEYIRRVVIDAPVGEAVVVHVERYGDERLLQVVRTLDGVEVREEPRTAAEVG